MNTLDEKRADKSTLTIGVMIVAVCLLATGAVIAILEFGLDLRLFRSPAMMLEIGGAVLDAATDVPVPNARVIVRVASRSGFKTRMACFATVTDSDGRFFVRKRTPFPIRPSIDVDAIASDNKFDAVTTVADVIDDRFVASVKLALSEQPQDEKTAAQFDSFGMPGCPDREMFDGEESKERANVDDDP